MDILVIDVANKWGMLLSRKWGTTLGGSIQMDWTYATVPASEFSLVKLYSEKEKRHHVENPQRPLNEYAYHTDENGTCYPPPCSCLCEVDPGWMVEGQATKGWNHDCLDSQMDGCHANQGSHHFMLS